MNYNDFLCATISWHLYKRPEHIKRSSTGDHDYCICSSHFADLMFAFCCFVFVVVPVGMFFVTCIWATVLRHEFWKIILSMFLQNVKNRAIGGECTSWLHPFWWQEQDFFFKSLAVVKRSWTGWKSDLKKWWLTLNGCHSCPFQSYHKCYCCCEIIVAFVVRGAIVWNRIF